MINTVGIKIDEQKSSDENSAEPYEETSEEDSEEHAFLEASTLCCLCINKDVFGLFLYSWMSNMPSLTSVAHNLEQYGMAIEKGRNSRNSTA